MMTSGGEALGVLITELELPCIRAQGLFPGAEQGVQAFMVRGKALAQLRVHQVS